MFNPLNYFYTILNIMKNYKYIFKSKGKLSINRYTKIDNNTEIEAREKSTLVLNGGGISPNCKLVAFNGGNLSVGKGTTFNNNCYVAAANNILIGNDVMVAPNVVIVDQDHDYAHGRGIKDRKYVCGEVIIGDNVWIGANTVILRGTKIGDNCVIGAGCVINSRIPNNTVVIQERTNKLKEYTFQRGEQ